MTSDLSAERTSISRVPRAPAPSRPADPELVDPTLSGPALSELTPSDPAVDAARAAAAAGVRVIELHDVAALHAAAGLFEQLWQTSPVTPDLMRAVSHAGGYVAGGFDGDRLVAASVAFHRGGPDRGLHSHISAVLPDLQGRDVGRALKLHQRAWACAQGLDTVSWTYDPLIRRNAWFNITKLGARAVNYLVDFYGPMLDALNKGDASDRAVAVWTLDAPHVRQAAAGRRSERDLPELLRAGAHLALRSDENGPTIVSGPAHASYVLVEVPEDIQALRASDLGLARRWRQASRSVLEPLLTGGYVATGFTRTGCYVLEQSPA